jgi:hypothetical protein
MPSRIFLLSGRKEAFQPLEGGHCEPKVTKPHQLRAPRLRILLTNLS